MMPSDTVIYAVAAAVCVFSSIVLCLFHYCAKRREKKQLQKGNFGFPVAAWKSYSEEYNASIDHLKKTIEEEESWKPVDQDVVRGRLDPTKQKSEEAPESSDEEALPHLEEITTTQSRPCSDENVDSSKEVERSQETAEMGDPNATSTPAELLETDKLSGKLKTLKIRQAAKKVEADMTDEQKQEEAEVRRQQLAKIFELMSQEQTKFGVSSVDDVQDQMRLYSL